MVILYTFFWHKDFDAHFTVMTVLVPIINLGFLLMAQAESLEAGLLAVRITYIGGCFLLLDVLFLVFNLCGVPLKRWQRAALMMLSGGIFLAAMSIGYSDIFYKSVGFEIINGVGVLVNKQYGVLHHLFYAMTIIYYVLIIGVIVYSFFKKKQVPRKLLIMI